jgi:hypothetical protein
MKKIILLIFSFFISTCYIFASDNLIKSENQKQYRQEINNCIKKQVPISKKEINKVIVNIQQEENIYIKNSLIDIGIESVLFNFYMQLIDITEKYVEIKKDIPSTDYYMVLKNTLSPYLNENNINTSKINSLLKYAEKKQKKLRKIYSD